MYDEQMSFPTAARQHSTTTEINILEVGERIKLP
jgi:hypothetical protein